MKTRITLLVMAILICSLAASAASDNIKFQKHGDVIIAVDSSGKQIRPDLKSGKKSGDLTFTFISTEYFWTADELATLNQWITDMYPLIKQVYGTPAFANSVNIRKDPNSVPTYWSYENEIVLSNIDTSDAFCHEVVHAFHDDFIIGNNAYEEGMARAVEVWVMSQLPVEQYPYGDRNHSSSQDDIWYEAHDVSPISCTYGNFFMGSPLSMCRYQQAGYAWGKCLIEDRRFFLKFNAAYYDAAREDSTIISDASRLKALVARVKKTVEGEAFETWYAAQKIFDFNPAAGYQLFLRGGEAFYAYSRNSNGQESPLSGLAVSWDIFDFQGYTLSSGSGNLTDLGWIFIPTYQITGYKGKITINVTVADSSQSFQSFTTLSPPTGEFAGIFGTVPADGTISISPLKGKTMTATVSHGAFSAPTLEKVAGQFTVTYQPADGSPSVSKVVTKDAASYYVKF